MVSVFDFVTGEGKTDWGAYKAAQKAERDAEVATGERCRTCGQLITFAPMASGAPAECFQCKDVQRPEALRHDRLIRCPKCGKTREVTDLFRKGDHDISCVACGHTFFVECLIEYSFRSPARLVVEGDR